MVQINLNDFENDSNISMFESATFSYDIVVPNGKINDVRVTLGSNTIAIGLPRGSFTLERYANGLITGQHTLKITVITTSGSNSLADKLGAEQFQIWRSWNLNVDVDLPEKPILTQTKENGLMKLSWSRYKKPNFKSYKVKLRRLEEISISDVNQNFYFISNYAGGYPLFCEVETYNTIGSASSDPLDRNDSFTLDATFNFSDSTVQLKWSKADFEGAFKSYTLVDNSITSETLATIETVTDTTLTFRPNNLLFGLSHRYSLLLNPLIGNSLGSNTFLLKNIAQNPTLTPTPNELSYNSTLSLIFGTSLNSQWVTRYDDQLNMAEEIVGLPSKYFSPFTGNKIYFTSSEIGIIQRNLETGAEKNIDIESLTTGGIFTNPSIGVCSDNEIVAFGYKAHNASGDALVSHVDIYNMATDVRLYHKEFAGSPIPILPVISSNGTYAKLDNNAMGKVGATDVHVLYVGFPHTFYAFRQDNESEFMTVASPLIYIHDSETGSVKRTINMSGFFFRGYDPGSKHILLAKYGSETSQVVNIETGERKTLPMYTNDPTRLMLINGFIVNSDGDYFKAIN